MTRRKCVKCNKTRLIKFFRFDHGCRVKTCNQCRSEHRRIKYRENPDAVNKTGYAWRKANRARTRIYHKNWRDKNPDKIRQDTRRKRALYPEKNRARDLLNKATSRGKIKRQPCEVCGETNVDGHHDDYSKPLEVRWLCKQHHHEEHRKLRRED